MIVTTTMTAMPRTTPSIILHTNHFHGKKKRI